jgi:hypothetical protein
VQQLVLDMPLDRTGPSERISLVSSGIDLFFRWANLLDRYRLLTFDSRWFRLDLNSLSLTIPECVSHKSVLARASKLISYGTLSLFVTLRLPLFKWLEQI